MIKKTKEDYLRAIYHLEEDKNDKEGLNSINLCKYLCISKASVSEMLRKLVKEQLIQPIHYGKIKLTKKGLNEAKAVTRKHRVIEVFLSNTLRRSTKAVHEESHKLEHAFSNESINAIEKMLIHTKKCPHGKPIP